MSSVSVFVHSSTHIYLIHETIHVIHPTIHIQIPRGGVRPRAVASPVVDEAHVVVQHALALREHLKQFTSGFYPDSNFTLVSPE